MNSRCIGKLVTISNQRIIAEMYESLGNYINTVDGIRFVGEISSYVTIEDIGRKIIAEVIGVEEKTMHSPTQMSKPLSDKYIYLSLIGEIVGQQFFFGVSKMPLIFSDICIITEHDLQIMLEVESDTVPISATDINTRAILLPIGQSVIFPDYKVRVNIDKFFGFHFSVFGNTGAGKSNTVARLLQNIFIKRNYSAKGAKFIIIDSNGEYRSAFEEIYISNVNIKSKMMSTDSDSELNKRLEIPVWALSADDWAVLLHASEKTQIPILRRAIDIAKIFFDPLQTDNKTKNHILASTLLGVLNSSDSSPSKSDKLKAILTTFCTDELYLDCVLSSGETIRHCVTNNYGQLNNIETFQSYCEQFVLNDILEDTAKHRLVVYDLNQFSEAVNFAVLYEGSISSHRIQEYTATLSTRLQALKDSEQGAVLTKTRFENINDYINDLVGSSQILNIDISGLDDSACEVVTKVIAKVLFDYLKKRNSKAEMPINLIIEEAHRFIKNEATFGALGYNIFERIAKEGRKFGLLLGISSQRPSELSKTVVSQCSNFIIHRVQNPDDLSYISRMVPYISEGIISRLTYLQTGHALVFGTAINLPTLTKFDIATPPTDSQNAKISDKWYIA